MASNGNITIAFMRANSASFMPGLIEFGAWLPGP